MAMAMAMAIAFKLISAADSENEVVHKIILHNIHNPLICAGIQPIAADP